ncbi:hypothetical protein ACSRAF_23690, partial [Salmonella enterica]
SMPKGIREFREDIQKKIRQTLQSQLTRLHHVSREQIDALSYTHHPAHHTSPTNSKPDYTMKKKKPRRAA